MCVEQAEWQTAPRDISCWRVHVVNLSNFLEITPWKKVEVIAIMHNRPRNYGWNCEDWNVGFHSFSLKSSAKYYRKEALERIWNKVSFFDLIVRPAVISAGTQYLESVITKDSPGAGMACYVSKAIRFF